VEAVALRELRQRVALGPSALPSVCCYTFHNAQDTYEVRAPFVSSLTDG